LLTQVTHRIVRVIFSSPAGWRNRARSRADFPIDPHPPWEAAEKRIVAANACSEA